MLPDDVSRLARRLLEPHLVARRRILERDVVEILEQCASRGIPAGTPVLVPTFDRCAAELEQRLGYAWAALLRTLRAGRIELYPGIEGDIEAELRSFSEAITRDLLQAVENKAKPINAKLEGRLDLMARWDEAVEQLMGEVHVEIYTLRSAAERTGASSSVHFHAPVGAYQTGSHASAHVTQTITMQAIGELQSILKDATTQLDAADTSAESLSEAKDLLEQGGTEAAKSKPDWPKLISALNSAVSLMEKMPNLRSTYYAVRGWLAANIMQG